MKHIFSQLPKSEIEITVTIPFNELEPFVKKAAKLFSAEIEIPGFRKGHASEAMLKERVGEMKILERAAEIAVRETYPKILTEAREKESSAGHDFMPIGKPEVTIIKLAPGNDLEYKVKFAILPEVILSDYKSIAAKIKKGKREVLVSDEEIEKSLEWLQNSRAALITVDRAAAFGDRVEINFEVRHGGVKIEGGESKNHPFVLGKGKFIPGFEDALLGVKAREEKSFTLIAPHDWREIAFAGKPLDFSVKMNLVQERKLPPLSDEFVKNFGGFESLEALKQNIREGLTSEKKDKEQQRVRSEIISEIAKSAKIDVPQIMVESELDKMFEELKSGIGNMGMKWEDYLLHIKKNQDELRKEWRDEAERRVRIALCLREIADREKIEPAREEIEARANEFLKQFESVEDAAKKFDPEALREYTKGILRNEKVFEYLEK